MKQHAYYSDYLWFDGKMLEKQWLLVENDIIKGRVVNDPPDTYERIVYQDSAILPTFINTHTHAAMNLLRGYADDLPLHEWLNDHIWPAEKRLLSAQYVKDSCMLATAELIRSGTSCINEMYFFTEVEMEVFEQVGLRGVFGNAFMTADPSKIYNIERLVERYKDNPTVNLALSPHAPYTASPEVYRKAVELALKYDIILHTHLSETASEVSDIVARYAMRPVFLMNEVGAFDCKSVFAHCVHLNDDEIELMGRKKVNVSTCIQSNLKLASGFAPIVRLMQAGANVSIGTDGASSNNDLDMHSEMQTSALFHKAFNNDSTAFDAKKAITAATENGAKALYLNNIGLLKEGYQADFMVVSYYSAHMQPVYNALSNFIYSAQKNDITDVFVAGKQLMRNRALTTIDENAVIAKAKEWAHKIKP